MPPFSSADALNESYVQGVAGLGKGGMKGCVEGYLGGWIGVGVA